MWREARQVENEAEYGARYYQLYRAEAWNAIANANRVNLDVMGVGRAGPVNSEERGYQYSARTALNQAL